MRALHLLLLSSSLGIYAGTITTVSTPFTGSDFIDWSAVQTAEGGSATVSSPLTSTTNLGVSFTVSDLSGSFLFDNFGGLSGRTLDTNTASATMTLAFTSPFDEVGFNMQVNAAFQTSYTVDVQVFDSGNNLMGTEHYSSVGVAPIFVGFQSTANDIAKLVITPAFNPGASLNHWAIEEVQLASASSGNVPEPGSFVLTALGIIAGGIVLRRHSPRSSPMPLGRFLPK